MEKVKQISKRGREILGAGIWTHFILVSSRITVMSEVMASDANSRFQARHVIDHNVDDDLDAYSVARVNHRLEFGAISSFGNNFVRYSLIVSPPLRARDVFCWRRYYRIVERDSSVT